MIHNTELEPDGRRHAGDRRQDDTRQLPGRRTGSDRRFGRAKKLNFRRRCTARVLDWGYHGGWAATLAHLVGLQGRLQTTPLTIASPRYHGAPLRFVFASDFHAGPVTHPAQLDRACRAIQDAKPELLLLGGDFVGWRASDADLLAERIGCLDAPLGKYAVLGNHDLIANDEHIVRELERAGVELLTNRNVRLPAPFDDVWVCGLDDPEMGSPDADAALEGANGVRLVLMHAPDGLFALEGRRFDAAFCGHVHGGQVALPGGIPIIVPTGRLCRRYSRGVFRVGDRDEATLVVSRGIGCSGVPVRLFSAPEIHECVLVASA